MRMLVATAVMVTAGASQRGDMSDEEVVTYPIDDVLAVLEHVEHMTLEQIEARIMEIEAEEDASPPGDRGVRETAAGCDVLQEVQPVSPVDRVGRWDLSRAISSSS